MTHATKSGVANFVFDDEQTCLEQVRYLMSFLPSNNLEDPPYFEPDDDPQRRCDGILDLIPDAPNKPYDMKKVIAEVVDDGDFFEVNSLWAMNIVCGFARVDGHVVGIVGNQPQVLAGCLDIDASEKAARFVRTCDAFNIPLVTFVDVPGFLPGTNQEYSGIIRHGAKLLYAYCEATVPAGADHHPQGLRRRVRRHELEVDRRGPRVRVAVGRDRGDGRERRGQHHLPARDRRRPRTRWRSKAELVEQYRERFANPYNAGERGYVDDVIDPRDTRKVLVESLEMLRSKKEKLPQRKHGNVPL